MYSDTGTKGKPYRVFTEVANVGKQVQSSKKRITWRFGWSNENASHELTLLHSLVSGKKTVSLNGIEVTSSGGILVSDFSYTWNVDGHFYRVEAKIGTESMELEYTFSIDGSNFLTWPTSREEVMRHSEHQGNRARTSSNGIRTNYQRSNAKEERKGSFGVKINGGNKNSVRPGNFEAPSAAANNEIFGEGSFDPFADSGSSTVPLSSVDAFQNSDPFAAPAPAPAPAPAEAFGGNSFDPFASCPSVPAPAPEPPCDPFRSTTTPAADPFGGSAPADPFASAIVLTPAPPSDPFSSTPASVPPEMPTTAPRSNDPVVAASVPATTAPPRTSSSGFDSFDGPSASRAADQSDPFAGASNFQALHSNNDPFASAEPTISTDNRSRLSSGFSDGGGSDPFSALTTSSGNAATLSASFVDPFATTTTSAASNDYVSMQPTVGGASNGVPIPSPAATPFSDVTTGLGAMNFSASGASPTAVMTPQQGMGGGNNSKIDAISNMFPTPEPSRHDVMNGGMGGFSQPQSAQQQQQMRNMGGSQMGMPVQQQPMAGMPQQPIMNQMGGMGLPMQQQQPMPFGGPMGNMHGGVPQAGGFQMMAGMPLQQPATKVPPPKTSLDDLRW